jgi:hypothetical protein
MMNHAIVAATGLLLLAAARNCAASDVPVPASCNPQVNAKLAQLIQSGAQQDVDNVIVCGVTTRASRHQTGGPNGGHEILSVRAQLPGIGARMIQIAINDQLDGVVTAPANASVFAYGQAYFENIGSYVAGIHDVHCSTHRGADNGWIVVNGKKSPVSCPSR